MQLLILSLLLGAAPLPLDTLAADLRFERGSLAGWQQKGDAFYVTTADARGPSRGCGVCSSDHGQVGATGWLRTVFVLPSGVRHIHFNAFAVRQASTRKA